MPALQAGLRSSGAGTLDAIMKCRPLVLVGGLLAYWIAVAAVFGVKGIVISVIAASILGLFFAEA